MDEVHAAQQVQAAASAWLEATIHYERVREALLMREARRQEAQRRAGGAV